MTKAQRWRRYWDRKSPGYDAEMGFWDRRLFGDSREWACGQAAGEVLEVAAGTGLNLPWYPAAVTLTGLDLSEGMLAVARGRARRLGHPVTLCEARGLRVERRERFKLGVVERLVARKLS